MWNKNISKINLHLIKKFVVAFAQLSPRLLHSSWLFLFSDKQWSNRLLNIKIMFPSTILKFNSGIKNSYADIE